MSNGNSGFTKIYSANNQFSSLTVGDINASNVDATVINGLQWVTVTGYVPTQFVGTAVGGFVPLFTSPGISSAVATTKVSDGRLLKIPAGVTLQQIVLTNNGTAVGSPGAATISVGGFTIVGDVNGNIQPGVGAPPYLAGTTLAAINTANGGCIQQPLAITAATGAAFSRTTVANFVAVSPAVAAINAGDMKVVITYSVVPGI
jgi:hypothetical protein